MKQEQYRPAHEFNRKLPDRGNVFTYDPQLAQKKLAEFYENHLTAPEILMGCRS